MANSNVILDLRCFTGRRTVVATCETLVIMATRIGFRVVLNDTVTLSDPQNPHFRTRIWHLALISYTSQVIANFMSKYVVNFCYHGNRGRSGANLNDTMKLADLENPPVWYNRIWYISPIRSRPSCSQFCVQTPKFVLWSHFTDSRSSLLQVPPPNRFDTYMYI